MVAQCCPLPSSPQSPAIVMVMEQSILLQHSLNNLSPTLMAGRQGIAEMHFSGPEWLEGLTKLCKISL